MKQKFLNTHLHILQLEGYSMARFLTWWIKHPIVVDTSGKKPLVYTPKIKKLLLISYFLLFIFLLFSLFTKIYLFGAISLIVFLSTPFLYLYLSLLLYKPYEIINRYLTIRRIRQFTRAIPDLTVIGVTGSYGKTSTKDFLFEILNSWKSTLKTPESYNTVFGIAKVVDLELRNVHKFFIVEMGAYVRGEIKELTQETPPRYAILTAIGTQHLERFKSLKNTTLAKFEIIDAVKPEHGLVNLDNPLIKDHISQLKYQKVRTYSLSDHQADFYLSHVKLTPLGMSFKLHSSSGSLDLSTPLFGTSNLQNLTAAISMAKMLGVPDRTIISTVSKLEPSPHRLQLLKLDHATLIDDAYSSNQQGFQNLIGDLKFLKGRKVLITPGIIELGKETAIIHQKLGRLAQRVFDKVVLVGHSDRTKNLEIGLKQPVDYIENKTNLWPLIHELSKKYDWILLENDLPDNF